MAEEIQISELELKEDLAGDLVFPVESSTDTNSTTLSALKDWLKGFFVGMTEDEEIAGIKRFLSVIRQQGGIPYTSAPTETTYNGLAVQDSNKSTWASFEGVQYNSGTNAVQMTVRGNSGTLRRMYVQENPSGAVTYNYGQAVGTNYIRIPRGAGTFVQYCWGSASKQSGNTFTFPVAFNSTPVVVAVIGPESGGSTINVITSSVTTTSFKVIHNAPAGDLSKNVSYIAIGTADM